MKPSDIYLDDDHIALMTPAVWIGRPQEPGDSSFVQPVIIKGNMKFTNEVYIDKPRPDSTAPGARFTLKGKPAVDRLGDSVGTVAAGVLSRGVGSDVTYYPHGMPSPAFVRLKKMSAPYNLYDLLETMKEAILDLQKRYG